MTKIVHLTSVHSPFDTRILLKQCRTLAKEGFEVVLIAPHVREEIVDGVTILPVPKPTGRLARIFATTFRMALAAFRENGDLYQIHDPELLPVAQWLRWRGKKVVFDMHENLPKAILSKPWIPHSLRSCSAQLCRMGERILLSRLPVIFAESSYQNDYSWIQRSSVVLNMPLVEELPHSQQLHKTPTVGYLGGVSPERGSTATIEALAILNKSKCKVHFECVGPISDEHRKKLLLRVEKLGLEGVHFYGRMPARNAWPIVAQCHFGVALLRDLPNFVESYPTKIFEYMGMGLPVITSDVPLYREVIDSCGCGICVDPDNPEEIANAILWLVSHPKEAKEMGRRGQQAVKKRLSWEAESLKLLSFYKELIHENCHSRRSPPSIHQSCDREQGTGAAA